MRESTPFPFRNDSGKRRFPWGALVVALISLTVPHVALPALRPLVRDMLDNLAAVNRIGEAVALEDYGRVVVAARELQERAVAMRDFDISVISVNPQQKPLWDAFLVAQEQAAGAVATAAEAEDPRAVMRASKLLVGNACLGCHASFRDPSRLLRPSVLFMTTFLSTWRDMNRGMVIKDYNLINLRARDLGALSEVIAADEILEETFGLGGSKQRRIFRGFLRRITENASEIAKAADSENLVAALEASQAMWLDGCIGCHEKFRR